MNGGANVSEADHTEGLARDLATTKERLRVGVCVGGQVCVARDLATTEERLRVGVGVCGWMGVCQVRNAYCEHVHAGLGRIDPKIKYQGHGQSSAQLDFNKYYSREAQRPIVWGFTETHETSCFSLLCFSILFREREVRFFAFSWKFGKGKKEKPGLW